MALICKSGHEVGLGLGIGLGLGLESGIGLGSGLGLGLAFCHWKDKGRIFTDKGQLQIRA